MKKYLYILPIFLVCFLLPACNDYGTEKIFDGLELYHTDKVTAAEADQLGEYLVKGKFANGQPKSVQLTKSGNTYQFRLVVKEGMDKDTAYLKTTKLFGSLLSAQVFNGAPLEVHLCDDHLKTLKVLVADDFGKEKIFDGTSLFHPKNITSAMVDSLGNYLITSKFANGQPKITMIAKKDQTYQFKLIVRKGADKSPDYQRNGRLFASELSRDVFHHAPVEVVMCDDDFNSLAILPMNDIRNK